MKPRKALNKTFTTISLLALLLGGGGGYIGAQKIFGDSPFKISSGENPVSVGVGAYAIQVGDPASPRWVRLSLVVQQSRENLMPRPRLRDLMWDLCIQAADMPMVVQSSDPQAAMIDAIRAIQPTLAPSLIAISLAAPKEEQAGEPS